MFRLSACTFGGGFVIVPLMRKRFVQDLEWIDEDEMLDLVAIAQSSPGAIAVNASVLVGYRLDGFTGALVAALGTIVPPLLIISIISFFYASMKDNVYVRAAMTGMLAGVAAVLVDVVITMARSIFKDKRVLPVIILIAAFAAVRWLHISIIWVLVLCGVAGAADTFWRGKADGGRA